MSSEDGNRSPYPAKQALIMLSRAGKSTTNQYLAFQKIEQGDGLATTPVRKTKKDAESSSLTPGAPVGFA